VLRVAIGLPPPAPPAHASYAALGADGCTFGGLTFRDITAVAMQFVALPATFISDAVQVTPFTRRVGGMSFVGSAVLPTGGFATSSAEALTGGDFCNDRCYQAGSSFILRVRVEGAAFTGAFGLGARTPRSLAATGADWLVTSYEQLAGMGGVSGPPFTGGASRQAAAGWSTTPETCFAVATSFDTVPCDGPAVIVQAQKYETYEGYLGVDVHTGYDPRSADGPHGDGSVAVAGAEFLFGVSAASTVPEPTALTLGGVGLAFLAGWRLRRRDA
jgi:hypothetical protein